MNFSNATQEQLYQIAMDETVRMSDRYQAARELQSRKFERLKRRMT